MKINLLTEITGIGKKPIDHEGVILTVKTSLLMALVLPNPDKNGSTPDDAVKTRRLFDLIDRAETEVDLKSDDIVKLKNLVAGRLSEFVAGAVIQHLEPDSE